MRLYPGKFVYHRQPTPVQADVNFSDVLSLASGSFIRLNNDTLIHDEDSLVYILNILAMALSSGAMRDRVTPFFSNGLIPNIQQSSTRLTMSQFLGHSRGISTYIGAFGIWRNDLSRIRASYPELAWKNSLGHVDCLFRLFEMGHSVVIHNKKYAIIDKPIRHGGYDIGKVFICEYLRLCRRALSKGFIDYKVFARETRRSISYSSAWFNNQALYPDLYGFEFDGFFSRVRAACAGRPVLLLEFYFSLGSDYILKCIRKYVITFLRFLLNCVGILKGVFRGRTSSRAKYFF
jgi:hypothetical protein